MFFCLKISILIWVFFSKFHRITFCCSYLGLFFIKLLKIGTAAAPPPHKDIFGITFLHSHKFVQKVCKVKRIFRPVKVWGWILKNFLVYFLVLERKMHFLYVLSSIFAKKVDILQKIVPRIPSQQLFIIIIITLLWNL